MNQKEKEKEKQDKIEEKKSQIREENTKRSDGRSSKHQRVFKEDYIKGNRSDKADREDRQFIDLPFTVEEANEIVIQKDYEIEELRKRVDELENQYYLM